MSRNLSVFVDLLRLGAALLVLSAHAAQVYHLRLPSIVAHSAKEGVAIFFVLSGFVIAFVATRKETDWQAFAKARLLRMYTVVPMALIVMVSCYAAGSWLRPDLYRADSAALTFVSGGALIGDPPKLTALLRYITFTNEVWFDRAVIRTGAPYWSLGYEVAYYVAFALLFYVRGLRRWIFAIGWLALCGPRVALAFPLWLIGAVAWSVLPRVPRLSMAAGCAVLVGVALALLGWKHGMGHRAVPLFEWAPHLRLAVSMLYYTVFCCLIAVALLAFAATMRNGIVWPYWLERMLRFLAGGSFTLYITHMPILILIAALWPSAVARLDAGLLAVGITIGLTLVLAEFGERRKTLYTRVIKRGRDRFTTASINLGNKTS